MPLTRAVSYRTELKLRVTLIMHAAARRRIEETIRDAAVKGVLRQLSSHVAQTIAARTARVGTPEAASVAAAWLEAALPSGDTAFYIGNVETLNAAAPARRPSAAKVDFGSGEQWRFGQWFNIEFGREFPHRGKTWIFQENPGPASSPNSDSNRPPGATMDDIEMTRWLGKTAPISRGPFQGVQRNIVRKRPGKGFAPSKSRYRRASELEPLTPLDLLLIETPKRERQYLRGRSKSRDPELDGFKGQGEFGHAPIRIGFVEGTKEFHKRIPAILQAELRRAGAAR